MKLIALRTTSSTLFWIVVSCSFSTLFCSLEVIWASPQSNSVSTSLRDLFLDNTGDYGEDIYTQLPSLFGGSTDEDSVYDRYAACLAATEGLRRIRVREIAKVREQVNKKGSFQRRNAENRIESDFEKHSNKVLNAFGMSLKEFNEIGEEIAEDEDLKEKIIEQAYLYRMAATVNTESPSSHVDESWEESKTKSSWKGRNHDKNTRFIEFSKSLVEIEKLRNNQIERLQRSLKVNKLPSSFDITDPSILPFLSPKVRAVVQAFPYQAEEIIKKHGLSSDEFNHMLKATKTNPLFRWRVQKQAERNNQIR